MESDAQIVERLVGGDPRALARAISRSESGVGAAIVRSVFARTGRAMRVGLTGPPGVGKSTLCGGLVRVARAEGWGVGVISVDPSSPFSRGAILGDRIRLAEHFTDPDVFIRSMASRGHLGGLAGASADALTLMDAFGKDLIVVETVGVGQSEIEIAELADTTIVALQPGSGDSVQLLKAGILEIADIFVVNKSDHPMALQLKREIRSMMEILEFEGWVPPIVATKATDGTGIEELWKAVRAHSDYLRTSGELSRRRRSAFAHQVRVLALGRIGARLDAELEHSGEASEAERDDPYAATERLLHEIAPGARWPRHTERRTAPVRATVRGL
jgi:LAO/AO transport system kinase